MKNRKRKVWLWTTFAIISTFVIGSIVAGYLLMNTTLNSSNKFYNGTVINGIDVSGMTVDEVSNLVGTKLVDSRNEIEFELTYKDRVWKWAGKDFEVNNKVLPLIENAYSYGRTGSFWDKRDAVKDIKNNGLNLNVSYKYVLGGLDEKINEVIAEIESQPVNSEVVFNNEKDNFEITAEQNGVKVDKDSLYQKIDELFLKNKKISVEVPTTEILPEITKEQLSKHYALRGRFSTSYAKSTNNRKENVKRALKDFNGKKVEPNETVSFNGVTGDKTVEKGYKPANIILNGVYVEGTGGGVCQSSTTLYNALLLADIQIDEVNKHSLPVSYVWLAFDAMVSEGYSDLTFTNNTEYPIYIKTGGDNENCYVEVYGEPLKDGFEVKRRAEFVRTIPHPGDVIIQDTEKEYADKVTFKGEYLRLKMPTEGYESKAYIDYYQDGVLTESKLIRHEIYQAQNGVIIEGTEDLYEGMTIPENTVKFIPSQQSSSINENNVNQKIEKERPEKYNP